MTAGALTHGYSTDTELPCPSSFRVGNRDFHNHESAAYGDASRSQKALEVSCNTFFFRIGYDYWQQFGSDAEDVDAKRPAGRGGRGLRIRDEDRDRPPGRGHRADRRS